MVHLTSKYKIATPSSKKLTKRLRDAREKRPEKAFPLLPRCIVDRHGDTHTLGDVVEGNGDGQSYPEGGGGESGDKRSQTLREIVDANSQSYKHDKYMYNHCCSEICTTDVRN